MIKFLSKSFGVCVIIAAVIFFVAGLVGGYYGAAAIIESAGLNNSFILRLCGIIVGGIVSFITVVLVYGYMAQIVDIRRRIENLEKIAVNVFTEKVEEEKK